MRRALAASSPAWASKIALSGGNEYRRVPSRLAGHQVIHFVVVDGVHVVCDDHLGAKDHPFGDDRRIGVVGDLAGRLQFGKTLEIEQVQNFTNASAGIRRRLKRYASR